MRRMLVLGLLAAAAAVASPADARNYGVAARDGSFAKAFVVVQVGDTVTWRNTGDEEHTVTSFPDAPKRFSSSSARQCVPNPIIGNDPDDCLDPGDTFTVRFTQPGTHDYFCKVHGDTAERPTNRRSGTEQPCGMCGQIVVKAAETVPPTTGNTGKPSTPPPATSSPSADPSASPSASPTTSPSEDPTGGAVASRDGGEGGGLGRGAIALLGIVALSGAGWWTWRRYLAGT